MIKAKLDVTKVDKTLLFKGKANAEGKHPMYLDLVFIPNRDGPGRYGDTHFIVQGVTKEQRESGVKGPIIGNATIEEDQRPQQQKRGYTTPEERDRVNKAHNYTPPAKAAEEEDEIPF